MKKVFLVGALAAGMLVLSALMSQPVVRTAEGRGAGPAPTPRMPIRPVSGAITFGFNKAASWSAKPHNGTDYVSGLGSPIKSVGKGVVHFYTKPNAGRFGSVNPDGAGPAIWVRYKLATGEPIYVLYGHCASSYVDQSKGSGKSFKFNVKYTLNLAAGGVVEAGAQIAKTAPYYNGGKPANHLHVSVFKPARRKNGTYYDPPTSGWGYSDISVAEGAYVNPEDFFTKSQYKLAPNP